MKKECDSTEKVHKHANFDAKNWLSVRKMDLLSNFLNLI